MVELPVLAITIGDPAGIGPEIVSKLLAGSAIGGARATYRPLVVGSQEVLLETIDALDLELDIGDYRQVDPQQASGVVPILDPDPGLEGVRPGEISEATGRASIRYVEAAVDLAKSGEVSGIVTAPINKAAIHAAGYTYPGHTELLAERFGIEDFSLVLTAQDLFLFHVTTHLALREACDLVTERRVFRTAALAHATLESLGVENRTVAVAGLNPHASEGGIFGTEDVEQIEPAIRKALEVGVDAVGPLPADAVIPKAFGGAYHAVVACYHDQGHVPFKAVYGESGVNVTVGLPVIRTSVDHGTALDIAGKGIARTTSLEEAIQTALRLAPYWPRIRARVRELYDSAYPPDS